MNPVNWDVSLLGPAIVLALITFVLGSLLAPLIKPLITRLGRQIDESFEAFTSGFSSRYRHYIIEQCRYMSLRGIKTTSPTSVELESIYMPARGKFRYAQSPDVLTRSQPVVLDEIVWKSRRLVVLGGPGSGKSTLLRHLALVCAKKEARQHLHTDRELLPIYLLLRDFRPEELAAGMPSIIDVVVQRSTVRNLRPSTRYLTKTFEQGGCLVLFDGLDEVENDQSRYRLVCWITDVVALYPKNVFVVASRPASYDLMPLGVGFCPLDLLDFTESQVQDFVRRWYQVVEIAVLEARDSELAHAQALQRAEDLVRTISEQKDIEKLAVNPLMLSIISLLHRYRGQLPRRRVELYAECVDMLLGYWDEAKGMTGEIAPQKKRAILQPLALEMHKASRRSLDRKNIERMIGEGLRELDSHGKDSSDFLDAICERSGLLVEEDRGIYAFSHLGFQEYLAARQISEMQHTYDILPYDINLQEPDIYIQYERGLMQMVKATTEHQAVHLEILVYQQRLLENLAQSQRYGDTETRRSERSEIIARLNDIAVSQLGISFNQLCNAATETARQESAGGLLIQHLADPWWREVILLYAAMDNPSSILRELMQDNFPDSRGLLLAGQVTAAAVEVDPEIRSIVVSRLDEAIPQLRSATELCDWVTIRSDVVNRDPIEYLCSLIRHDEHINQHMAAGLGLAASNLGSSQLPEAVKAILDLSNEKNHFSDGILALAQIELSSLFGLPPDVFKVLTDLLSRRVRDLLSLAGDNRQDLTVRYSCARLLNLTMAKVPAGSFWMGSIDPQTRSDEHPVHEVYLSGYWIDICPVTNLQYLIFLESTGNLPPPQWSEEWAKGIGACNPVVNVTFHDCTAYATWLGKRLPTEAEWERAARGEDKRIWPWGSRSEVLLCNVAPSNIGQPSAVGAFPENRSPYGLLDAAGNVWEYTTSFYKPYPYDPEDRGRHHLPDEGYRVLRGGSYKSEDIFAARTTIRHWDFPTYNDDWGFRCALSR